MLKNFNVDKTRLITNFCSLFSVEAANYIFPLITLPYLVRVLGPEKFGLVAFAQAFVQYFMMLTDYGFNLSATRNISINREDLKKVSVIFSAVSMIKLMLVGISSIVLVALVILIPKFQDDPFVYIFSFGTVLGNGLFPIWFFQGMERMKFIAFLNFLAKLVFVFAIFIFIKKQNDYVFVPLINSAGYILSGIISVYVAFRYFKIRFRMPTRQEIVYELKEGWHIFISTAAVSLYTNSNTVILGFLTNNVIVGYYSAAEKIVNSSLRFLNPIFQSIYPYIGKLVSDSKEKTLAFIKKTAICIGGTVFAISLGIFIAAGPIVNIIFGIEYKESVVVLKILAFLPFITALSNIFAIQGLVNFNFSNVISKIAIRGGILNLILAPVLIYSFKQIGLAISVLIVELFITLQGAYYFEKYILRKGNRCF
jgi:PST family polysaccharide transporter